MGGSEFEDTTLDEMYSMVCNSNPKELADRATALNQAASDLYSRSRLLRTAVHAVEWKGEGDSRRSGTSAIFRPGPR